MQSPLSSAASSLGTLAGILLLGTLVWTLFLPTSEGDTPLVVGGGYLNGYFVPRNHVDSEPAHLTGQMTEHTLTGTFFTNLYKIVVVAEDLFDDPLRMVLFITCLFRNNINNVRPYLLWS